MTALLVHEWIEAHGGSENVFEAMADAYPEADIRCLWDDAPDRFSERKVTQSWLSATPLRRNKIAALPFMPTTWQSMKISNYDFVLVSSHLFAHHIGQTSRRQTAARPQKFVYVHTPARYIWAPESDPRGRSPLARIAAPVLRRLDARRAKEGALFAANSEYVRERIRSTWDRDAVVIYPPVDVERIQSVEKWRDRLSASDRALLATLPHDFILGASRFASYKRLELVIEAGETARVPVVLAGAGPERNRLARLAADARVPVQIVDSPSTELLYALYQQAMVFFFPSVEDFGIMPVEAMSLGTPVVVAAEGGAKESIAELRGGVVLESTSSIDIAQSIDRAQQMQMDYAVLHAEEYFGKTAFSDRLRSWVGSHLQGAS